MSEFLTFSSRAVAFSFFFLCRIIDAMFMVARSEFQFEILSIIPNPDPSKLRHSLWGRDFFVTHAGSHSPVLYFLIPAGELSSPF
jgi:hypothetical protein